MVREAVERLGPALARHGALAARGRSAQTFLIEAVVRRGSEERRAVVRGQDIYAVTAPLVVEALRRLLAQSPMRRGVVTAGELGARGYLEALDPRHLTFEDAQTITLPPLTSTTIPVIHAD